MLTVSPNMWNDRWYSYEPRPICGSADMSFPLILSGGCVRSIAPFCRRIGISVVCACVFYWPLRWWLFGCSLAALWPPSPLPSSSSPFAACFCCCGLMTLLHTKMCRRGGNRFATEISSNVACCVCV